MDTPTCTDKISLLITSCNRFDLLEQTLRSFVAHNTYRIDQTIIVDDSNAQTPVFLGEISGLGEVTFISSGINRGQLYSADKLMEECRNEFIMWGEDDWSFYRGGFIEASLPILMRFPKILQVWIRADGDTNGHPIEQLPDAPFDLMALDYNYKYNGFSMNPGVRRRSDWQAIGGYGKHWPYKAEGALRGEEVIGEVYRDLGYRAAILRGGGYVKHTGHGRHVGKTMHQAYR